VIHRSKTVSSSKESHVLVTGYNTDDGDEDELDDVDDDLDVFSC